MFRIGCVRLEGSVSFLALHSVAACDAPGRARLKEHQELVVQVAYGHGVPVPAKAAAAFSKGSSEVPLPVGRGGPVLSFLSPFASPFAHFAGGWSGPCCWLAWRLSLSTSISSCDGAGAIEGGGVAVRGVDDWLGACSLLLCMNRLNCSSSACACRSSSRSG